jgi:AcrR family transcriptional regulator
MSAVEPNEIVSRDGVLPHMSKRIERAAVELFFERGFAATTMREIAVACEVTPGALYNHFPSKDHLLYTIIKDVHDKLDETITDAIEAAADDPLSQLRAYARAHALFHTHLRHEARVANEEIGALPEAQRREIVDIRRRKQNQLRDILRRGREAGVFDIPNEKAVANFILTMAISVAGWFRSDGALSAEEVADLDAELAVRMVTGEGR